MFAMTDNSVVLAKCCDQDYVEIIEKVNELWWKVKYHGCIGYIRTQNLKCENFDEEMVTVSIPKRSATALFEALKISLNK